MANFTRGKVRIEDSDAGSENGRWVVMYEIDCFPPPAGSERALNYDTKAVTLVQQRFIQQSEMTALLDGANSPGDSTDAPGILAAIRNGLGYGEVTIDEAKVPVPWKNTEPCFWVTISYRVKYLVKEIRVTAAQEFTSGSNTYPVGDVVASFRMLVPDEYEFMRSYIWNEKCCKDGKPREKEPDYCNPFPPKFKWELSPGIKFKFGLGLEHDWWKDYYKYNYNEEKPDGQ